MIRIIKAKSDRVYSCENSIYVSFPFDLKILDIVKSMKVRLYSPDTKMWELPEFCLVDLTKKFVEAGYQYEIQDTIEVEEPEHPCEVIELENYELPNDVEFKTDPLEHQKYGVAYGIAHTSFILGDEQGLGKTKQIIDLAVYRKKQGKIKRCLIICGVNTLKYNWLDEIEKHSFEKGWILGTRYNKKGKAVIKSSTEKLEDLINPPDCLFLITNIETLRKSAKQTSPIIQQIIKLIKDGEINMIAIDECHRCKDPASQQGRGLLEIHKACGNIPIIPMSGTPFMNNPLDLYVPLRLIGDETHSIYQFRNFYCVLGGFANTEVMGYKNMQHLRDRLKRCMLRRTKEQVLDLPPKVHTVEYVEMNTKQKRVYDEVLGMLRDNIDKIKNSNDPLAQLIRLRQATGYTGILSSSIEESAKLDRMEELVEEIIANNRKVIIFSQWEQIIQEVMRRLAKYKPLSITGSVNDAERNEYKHKFQEDENYKIITGTIGAMGTGLTLNKANTIIFLDSPWNKATKDQAEDRAHRIGTVGSVNIITLVTKDTIDEKIEDIVYRKGVMGDFLVDGVIRRDQAINIVNQVLA